LISTEFFPNQLKAWSSSAERCQQTLQSVMSGFYTPQGRSIWSSTLKWQPVPYEISDPLLRMYNVKCPHYTTSYQPISDDTSRAAYEWLTKDKELVRYIARNSGLNASLSDIADVADNIMNMKMFNVPLPRWVTNPTHPGYPPKDMAKAIISFAEAHQILCANDTECARMMAGLWLDNIIQTLKQLRDGSLKGRMANFYAAHTETVLSLIRLMKTDGVHDTPTSAGLILEYTDVPTPSVRFIFHEPDPENPDVRLAELKSFPYCPNQQWCNLETFIQNVRQTSFSDWQAACKLPKCPI
jgi:prostatic aicd phosphatase